jgi:hypothetical protein
MTGSQHERPRRSQQSVRAPAKASVDAIRFLQTELEEERASRQAIEKQLGELTAAITALREEVQALEGIRPAANSSPTATSRRGASRLVEIPRDADTSGRAYWLRRCEGFRVVVDSHSLGTVEAIHFGLHHDRPDTVIVRADGRGHRLFHVTVENIAELSFEDGLITLANDPREPEAGRRGARVRSFTRILRYAQKAERTDPAQPDLGG